MARYTRANQMAEKAANKPFKKYQGEFVAPVNQQQLSGIDTINNSVDAADPYFAQAQDYLTRGSGTAQPGELDINRYMSPYMDEVVDSTAALIDQGNEQQMSGSLGDLIKGGGFGGDRAGIASAVLAGQQQMGRANTLSGLKQAGYQQAVGTAQQQQGTQLAADQADLARLLQASGQSTQTGAAVQQAGLAGGEAQINAGTLQQQTQQAQDTAKYQQFLQKRGYPFQVAQFLANIAMGTGALSGSTTTTEQPAPFFSDRRLKTDVKRIGKSDDGLPIYSYKYKGDNQTQIGFMADEVEKKHPEAVGVAGGYKTVDYAKATDQRDGKAAGGGVYGHEFGSDAPYGGASYVPEDQLRIADMKFAEPVTGPPKSALSGMKELWDTGKEVYGIGDTVSGWFDDTPEAKATGGVVGASYLGSKPDIVENPEDTLGDIVESQEEGDTPRLPEPKAAPAPQSGASGIGSLLSGIASIFALSDPKVKDSVKRIGKTDEGMPIYSFKYKGQPHTHIGFMADEVQKKHPDAVRTIGGLKHVNLEKAHTFAEGGVVLPEGDDAPMPEFYRDEPPEEVDLAPLREAIASKESPNYYTITGGKKFDSYDDHPRERVPLKGDDYSTAAGRFQIIEPTWDAAAKKLGLKDFSPLNQNKAADEIARSDYSKRTGSDLGADIQAEKYGDVRKGLAKTWRGLENLTDEDFAKFFEPQNAEYLPREDRRYGGGVRPRYADGGIPRIVEEEGTPYGTVVEPEYRETPHRYTPPGMKVSDMDGETLVRSPVVALEPRVVKKAPTLAEAKFAEEKPLTASDYPGGIKPVDAPAMVEDTAVATGVKPVEAPFDKILTPQKTATEDRPIASKNRIFNDFMNTVKTKITNPYGLAAVAATGDRESKFSPQNVNRSWSDPSQSGDPGTAGYIMSWRGPRRTNLINFAAEQGEDPGNISVPTQANFFLQENPELIEALNNAKSVEEAQSIMNRAWAFAGHDNPNDPETKARFATARNYLNDMGGSLSETAEGVKNVVGDTVSGVKNTASTLGDFVKDTGGGMKDFLSRNKGNTDMILSILSGLGTMASSDSRYLGSAMLQGLGGGAKTYADLQKQSADIRATDTNTRAQAINSVYDSIKPVDGVNWILNDRGKMVPFWDAVQDPNFRGVGGQQLDETIRKIAIDAYRQGKDPNKIQFGNPVQTKPVEAAQVEGMPQPTGADDEGGKIAQQRPLTTQPSGVLWDQGSQDAIERNKEILSRQGNMIAPEVKRTTEVIIPQAQAQADASASNQLGLQEQVTTVAQAIAANNIGTGGDVWAKYWVQPINTIARAAGLPTISAGDDADTQRIKLSKIAALNADNFKPEDQNAYAALEMFRDISPNLEMTPEAASDITAQQMIMNQGPMDKAAYYNEVLRQSPAGRGVITSSNDAAFRDAYGPIYQKEKHDISELLRQAKTNPKVAEFIKGATTGALKPKDIQDGFEYYLGHKPSTDIIYRYFRRG